MGASGEREGDVSEDKGAINLKLEHIKPRKVITWLG